MFNEQLRALREKSGMSQRDLAKELFVSQQAVGKWETGKATPDPATIGIIAALFQVSTDTLILPPKRKGIKIPVLGRVQAGIPIEAIEEIIDHEEITPELAATGEFFALIIRGNSMEPKMSDGDVVIVRKQSDVTSGDTAVVIINGHDATIKKLIKKDNGIVLQPTNTSHDHLFYTHDEIKRLPVVVIGRVVELRAKF